MDTVRNAVAFYGDLAKIISDTYSGYLYGKNYERIKATAAEIKMKLSAVGMVCTTRFCSSEVKVYGNFAANLITLIRDLERQSKTVEAGRIKNLTFVVQLFGAIDLIRHVKNISLYMQTVNQLP